MYLRDEKGNKPKSYLSTIWRMRRFFSDLYLPISELTARKCVGYYEALTKQPSRYKKPYATDSHRNILAEAKTFLKWCSQEKGWLSKNPLEEVQGQGKRRHGKAQLRIDEARAWLVKALEMADKAKPGAVAALVALLMGMRGGEIVSRVVRDLDDQGRLLWIPDSKTPSGKRRLEVPELIRPYLRALAKDRPANELLFGMHRGRPHLCAWVRLWVKQICKAANVPMVTAHGMRGLHSTLALSAGTSGHVVAASLGHASITTTLESYADSSAVAHATQQKVLTVLKGG